MSKSETNLENNTKKHQDLKDKVDSARKAYDESVKSTGKNSQASKELGEELKKVEADFKAQEEVVKRNISTVSNYETKLNGAEAELKNYNLN